jgi:coenzyme F420-0:L-glutamate ligase/coenzyme F420-1:gamma-L-glutamate ligase
MSDKAISMSTTDTLMQLIRTRRSIRQFEPRPVPHPLIERLVEAACWAPSAHNRQPWRFVVLAEEGRIRQLAGAMGARLTADLRADGLDEAQIAREVGRSHQRLTGAPVLVLVCLSMQDMDRYPDAIRQQNERIMAVQSVAMAAQNLLLMAHAEGLGACWLCAPLFCPEVVRETLGLPPAFEPQGVIVLGYPAERRGHSKTREPLDTRLIFVR